MEAKFTPGPWRYVYEGSGDFLVVSDNGQEIGTAWSKDAHFLGRGATAERNEANAALIASAPDMYRLLERLAAGTSKPRSPALAALEADARAILATIKKGGE